jgi:hypothetical protein
MERRRRGKKAKTISMGRRKGNTMRRRDGSCQRQTSSS